jgi:hypothetical protein
MLSTFILILTLKKKLTAEKYMNLFSEMSRKKVNDIVQESSERKWELERNDGKRMKM